MINVNKLCFTAACTRDGCGSNTAIIAILTIPNEISSIMIGHKDFACDGIKNGNFLISNQEMLANIDNPASITAMPAPNIQRLLGFASVLANKVTPAMYTPIPPAITRKGGVK